MNFIHMMLIHETETKFQSSDLCFVWREGMFRMGEMIVSKNERRNLMLENSMMSSGIFLI